MIQLEHGRPADWAERMDNEKRVYEFLEELGISYDRADHGEAMTMEACEAVDAALGCRICKNLLLCNRQQTDFYLLMLPAEKVFKTSVLSKEIGSSRLSFADGRFMEEFLDITPGSLSVLGLMNDRNHRVRLLIDEALTREAFVGVHPCRNTSSLKLSTRDLLETILPALDHAPTFVTLLPQ